MKMTHDQFVLPHDFADQYLGKWKLPEPAPRRPSIEQLVFEDAFKLIQNRNGWCQHHMSIPIRPINIPLNDDPISVVVARDAAYHSTIRMRRIDRAFCSAGAVREAIDHLIGHGDRGRDIFERVIAMLDRTVIRIGGANGIVNYNDSHTHDQVVGVWRYCYQLQGWS